MFGLGSQNELSDSKVARIVRPKVRVRYSVECPWECMGDVLESQESERLSFNGQLCDRVSKNGQGF
jgi:hypothetical protein